jgi:hypothetical protein
VSIARNQLPAALPRTVNPDLGQGSDDIAQPLERQPKPIEGFQPRDVDDVQSDCCVIRGAEKRILGRSILREPLNSGVAQL